MNTQNATPKESTDRRTIRAATESMVVSPRGKGKFDVYNREGRRYVVSLLEETCTCPDFERRGAYLPNGCKHFQRVEIEAGLREIPAELGRCDARIMRDARDRRQARREPAPVAMTDGGRERPDDCDCEDLTSGGLPCWPCYREGFETAL